MSTFFLHCRVSFEKILNFFFVVRKRSSCFEGFCLSLKCVSISDTNAALHPISNRWTFTTQLQFLKDWSTMKTRCSTFQLHCSHGDDDDTSGYVRRCDNRVIRRLSHWPWNIVFMRNRCARKRSALMALHDPLNLVHFSILEVIWLMRVTAIFPNEKNIFLLNLEFRCMV